MSFDWSQYLDLARDLFTQAASTPYEDANLRSVISRAYYEAFHKARPRLQDKWGISVQTNATAHGAVLLLFALITSLHSRSSNDPVQRFLCRRHSTRVLRCR